METPLICSDRTTPPEYFALVSHSPLSVIFPSQEGNTTLPLVLLPPPPLLLILSYLIKHSCNHCSTIQEYSSGTSSSTEGPVSTVKHVPDLHPSRCSDAAMLSPLAPPRGLPKQAPNNHPPPHGVPQCPSFRWLCRPLKHQPYRGTCCWCRHREAKLAVTMPPSSFVEGDGLDAATAARRRAAGKGRSCQRGC